MLPTRKKARLITAKNGLSENKTKLSSICRKEKKKEKQNVD